MGVEPTSESVATTPPVKSPPSRAKRRDPLPAALLAELGLDDEATVESLKDWLAYKRERGERYKTTRWLRPLGKLGPERTRAAIALSMDRDWAGIHEGNNGSRQTTNRSQYPGRYDHIGLPS